MILTRRSILASLPAAAFAVKRGFAFQPDTNRIFIGTSGKISKGIYSAPFNATTGELGSITLAAEVATPSFLAVDRGHLYACTEGDGGKAKVSAFDVTATGLTPLNTQPSLGDGTTYVSARNHAVFAANYTGGSVTSFRTERDGSLSKPVSHFQYTGTGPNKERQEHSHAHSALPSPDGRFLLVNDLGLDRIHIYRIQPGTATLTPNDPPAFNTRSAAGPRHLAWHPNGRWLYSVNELDSTVDLLDWNPATGTLKQGPFVSTLKPDFPPTPPSRERS